VNLAGLILCGGASRRMGSPKALLDLNGETFLDRLIRILGASCREVTVVLGHEPDAILPGLRRASEVRFVRNPNWEAGQLSSLQTGLRSIKSADCIVFTPVDYPSIENSTVSALAAAIASDDRNRLFFVPRHGGRHGHPICFRNSVTAEFLALPVEASAREVIRAHRAHTLYVDVVDPGILCDVDDPASYQRLVSGRGA
jgi:CTP:molybdopterin cytidylyltransferase MocA